jgi:hypothetical protein
MLRRSALPPPLVSLLLIAGCGGSSDSSNTVTESDVINALHLTRDKSGVGYLTPDGDCEVMVILNSKEEVDLYTHAGDPVAKNSDGTVGLKVGSTTGSIPEAGHCVERLGDELDAAF